MFGAASQKTRKHLLYGKQGWVQQLVAPKIFTGKLKLFKEFGSYYTKIYFVNH